MKTVLIIDDATENLTLASQALKEHFRVVACKSGEKGLEMLDKQQVDIILLDIIMPEMDGYEVLRRIQASKHAEIPTIFLTAKSDPEDEAYGLELGAVDYITKPLSIPLVIARLNTHLQNKESRDFLIHRADILEDEVQKRTKEVTDIQDITINALANLAETRDEDTGNHIRRTQYYVKILAEEMAEDERYKGVLTKKDINLLFKSAPLHDIGKVGIPDAILQKPGRHSEEEFRHMKCHAVIGYNALCRAADEAQVSSAFLEYSKEIALCHHEKWDGSGYPNGLQGEEIPLSARLMAIADVYDALISERVYKPAFPHEKAVSIILEGKGSHFDPNIVDTFMRLEGKFREIAESYKD